jgi:hypothetical protein
MRRRACLSTTLAGTGSGWAAPRRLSSIRWRSWRPRPTAFARPQGDGLASTYGYAYQFDAVLFGPFMRDFAVGHGARRIEGHVVDVARDGESGDVTALTLADGQVVEGDLFVDCSALPACCWARRWASRGGLGPLVAM